MPACCAHCDAILEAKEVHLCPEGARASGDRRDVQAPRVGALIAGRWRLEKRLGHGACATVFLAQDLKQRRAVAVKFLSGHSSTDPKQIARFEREAALMGNLDHPNIAALFAVGRLGALPFLVMKYVRGITLADHRKGLGGRLSPHEMLRVVRPVCDALGYMHESGLVHRDVKPANIMVGGDGQVTLLDLGVARDPAMPALTLEGEMIGTPYYMAPEQIDGKGEVDQRADLYSLGALVFELLSGAPPYTEGGELGVMRGHRFDPVPNLAAVANIHAALSNPVSHALSKKPSKRFATAAQFFGALEEGCAFGYPPGVHREEPAVRRANPPKVQGHEAAASSTLVDDDEPEPSPAGPPPSTKAEAKVHPRSPKLATPPPSESAARPVRRPHEEDEAIGARALEPNATLDAPDRIDSLPGVDKPGETLMLPEGEDEPRLPGGWRGPGAGFGRIRVAATHRGAPSWANVVIDGMPSGVSPLCVAVLPGQHLVRLERAGFGAIERTVQVGVAGESKPVELELKQVKR